ncbi:glycerophosphodiester phosphodiesterase family protein [Sinorhizobium alkalisoli]|uniref:Glycerophosphodiester phosphodiesterase n=1 Tax=Sinorhizobium alkalisoli TaxID=1752398 RepID=A0A1E3VEX8_9HYPH|nr:glycerophosphodiester phosphodiesterase family protein [Sinorhizobium alkalisoli]ODR92138.1 glycerophosphodiester phosphodiesterase [Sinorhizobium alkalisoli]QFI68960.1 Glycerophosphoryl diester phosphodiesterase [Sinorhizobium alkalisoli]
MRWTALFLSALVFAFVCPPAFSAETTRATQILDRLKHANDWRRHVMVVAHRTGWKDQGRMVRAENSLEAIRNAIALGAEMIELDVRKSADGTFVLMHDDFLDRTTTCRGETKTRTVAELKNCRLIVEGGGIVTDETVPTLKEALLVAKDRILVNIDNKLTAAVLPEIAAEARAFGMADQILIKENLWNERRIADTRALMAAVGPDVTFMPILADDAVHDARFMAQATGTFGAPAAELVHWHADGTPMTKDGGVLFSAKARAEAIRGNWHLWVNTYPIVNRPPGMLAGGRGDERAVLDGLPQESWGFWIDRGATIIQTDEPKALIGWLEENGYRIPYDLMN